MHLLLWISVMLDFICTGFAELWKTGAKMKNENLPPAEFETTPGTAFES